MNSIIETKETQQDNIRQQVRTRCGEIGPYIECRRSSGAGPAGGRGLWGGLGARILSDGILRHEPR